MQRRQFISGVGATAAVWPFASPAQQAGRVYRIGYLAVGSREQQLHLIGAFEGGLRSLGYVVGNNLRIEYRFAGGQMERLPQLAQDLVRLDVDVIIVSNNANASAALRATNRIPIVMANSIDPVGAGLVASLARPGGNVTGYTQDAGGHEIEGKRLEFLMAAVPHLARVGVLFNPDFASNEGRLTMIRRLAGQLGLAVVPVEMRGVQSLESAFRHMIDERVDGFILLADPVIFNLRGQIASMAVEHRLPSISTGRDFAEAGLLLTYGVDFQKTFRAVGVFVDKIFKGFSPADLPVEQPTNFELVVNLKTARLLGVAVSSNLLVHADEILE